MDISTNPILQQKKHIIFDFDGVIYTLDWSYGEALSDYRSRVWDMVGEIDPSLPSQVDKSKTSYHLTDLAIKNYRDEAKKPIFEFYEQKERTLLDTAKAHIETIDFIKENADLYDFHIWSNNTFNTIQTLLSRSKIYEYFNVISARDKYDFAKPDPGGFELIFDPKQHRLEDFILIGDSLESDKKAAENAGIDFLYYKKYE